MGIHRYSHWWEDVLANFGQHHWMEKFRMSRETFQYLCNQLRPLIQYRSGTLAWEGLCLLSIGLPSCTLWVLATPSEYRSVAHLFGVAWCTLCQTVKETCRAILRKLILFILISQLGDGLKEVVNGFRDKWDVPQCTGSIGRSHIPVMLLAMKFHYAFGAIFIIFQLIEYATETIVYQAYIQCCSAFWYANGEYHSETSP